MSELENVVDVESDVVENVESEKPARVKKEKPVFELVGSEDANVYPFNCELPDGYVFGKFAVLKKQDFKEEYLYTLYRACKAEHDAVVLREKAKEIKSLGSSKQRAQAKKLIKMREQLAALQEQLIAQGIDIDSL